MYEPISCEFFDQLQVAIERKIPSTIVYVKNEHPHTLKGVVQTLDILEGKEFLVLKNQEKIRLDWVVTFNGKRYKEDIV